MQRADVNGIELAWRSVGHVGDPVLLMIQGLSMPSVAWPESMVTGLADRGFRVITFDNRDAGQSSKLDHLGSPGAVTPVIRRLLGVPVSPPYTLSDMAGDAAGLLAELGIETAHVVGVSMGGMIGQRMAIQHAGRVSSLVSLSSSTGRRGSLFPSRRVALHMAKGSNLRGEKAKFDYHDTLWQLLSSPSYPMTDAERHGFIRRLLEHGMSAAGALRQASAILADTGRREELRNVSIPSLVIHGDADAMLHVRGGRETAHAIPGAELKIVSGMGHDLPESLLPTLVDWIHSHAARAEHA